MCTDDGAAREPNTLVDDYVRREPATVFDNHRRVHKPLLPHRLVAGEEMIVCVDARARSNDHLPADENARAAVDDGERSNDGSVRNIDRSFASGYEAAI